MGEAPKKKHAHFRDTHPALSEYNDWWNSVHVLRCDAEDFAAGRTQSFYTKNSLSQGPLLNRALRTIARGLWLLRSGLVHNNSHWEHLMLRALQSYVTIRDKRWRFAVRDPTKEEADEIIELAEKNLRASRPHRVSAVRQPGNVNRGDVPSLWCKRLEKEVRSG